MFGRPSNWVPGSGGRAARKQREAAAAQAAAATAAAAAAAAADAQGVAAFAAEGDAGKLLRVTYKFDAVVAQARVVLINHDYVTIPFPVGPENSADLDADAAIAAYVRDGTLPNVAREGTADPPTDPPLPNTALSAANAVTKENLLDVLLRMASVRDLRAALAAVVFDTRAGDARGPPYAAGRGKFNLSVDARPYAAGAGGDARFRALLSCFYGERLVQPCVRDNQAVYAHMKLVDELTPDCKTALITAIIGDFPPSDELCAALADAADAQAPAAAAAAGGLGGGGGAGAGGVDLEALRAAVLAAQQEEAAAHAAGDDAAEAAAHARFEAAEQALRLAQVHAGGARRYRQSRPRHSRHSRRKGRSQQGRSSRRQ